MRPKKFLFLLIFAGAVIYGGLKGYIYFSIKGKLEKLQKMAAPFATLTYGKIDSDLRGKITVKDISVIPMGTTLEFRAEEMEVEGPDLAFLLALSGDFNNSEPPDHMYLHFRRARVPSDEELMSQLGGLSSLSAAQTKPLRPPKACTLGGILQHIGIEKIGYGILPIDFSIGYEYYQPGDELTVSSDYNRPGLESFEWRMVFKNLPSKDQLMLGSMPKLTKMEGNYRVDKTYMKRMVEYCAKQANETPKQYVSGLFNKPDNYYARNLGIIPGQGIRLALRSLLTGAHELSFSAYPTVEITAEMVSTYQPNELLSMLGMQMSVDGKKIPDMSFTVPRNLQAYSDDSSGDQSSRPTEAELRAQRKPRKYIKTDLAELGHYLGASIHLYIKDEDKMRVGILDNIGDGVLDIKQRVSGGTFVAHIPIRTIESVEVWRTEE